MRRKFIFLKLIYIFLIISILFPATTASPNLNKIEHDNLDNINSKYYKDYMFKHIWNLSNITKAYPKGLLSRGREWGSWGEINASELIEHEMNKIGLSNVHRELISGNKLFEKNPINHFKSIDDKMHVNSFMLRKNKSKDEIDCFPIPSALKPNFPIFSQVDYNYSFNDISVIPISELSFEKILSLNNMGVKWVSLHRCPSIEKLMEEGKVYNQWFAENILKTYVYRFFWFKNQGYRGGIFCDLNNNSYYMTMSQRRWRLDTPYKRVIPNIPVPIFSVNGSIGKKLGEVEGCNYSKIDYYINQSYRKNIESYNVIGTIPGEDHTKTVIIGNHYDSWWGQCSGDSAASNGILLGIAKYILDNNLTPKYDIDFISFAGEEYGFRGSYYHSLSNEEKEIPFMLSLDQLAYDQSSPDVFLDLWPNNKYVEKTMREIIKQSNYENRTGHELNWEFIEKKDVCPSDTHPFNLRKNVNTLCFGKDRNWLNYHRMGNNGNLGDTIENINKTKLGIISEVIWNTTYLFFFNQDYDININFTGSNNSGFFNEIRLDLNPRLLKRIIWLKRFGNPLL